ncbi:hypothetical protein JL100_011555 [Skermanella mucosa]|uniref:hypothetical protein n=1 Tax=Skermanella mucosa TaxID=1789672 RepID=UPI00192AEC3E|nr:hypothetical protein [Skermanella mucosa]UEM23332.1 hypothetical protein JL100_011555 [Skermanella mucosa]
MKIIERRPGGYLVDCGCAHGGPFVQRRPALAAECPKCGKTGMMAELVTTWVIANDRERIEAAD